MADGLDIDAMLARFRDRAAAVRKRNLPPVGGEERTRLVAQAQTGWAYVDLERGRPVKIPDDIRARYPLDPPFAWAAGTKV